MDRSRAPVLPCRPRWLAHEQKDKKNYMQMLKNDDKKADRIQTNLDGYQNRFIYSADFVHIYIYTYFLFFIQSSSFGPFWYSDKHILVHAIPASRHRPHACIMMADRYEKKKKKKHEKN